MHMNSFIYAADFFKTVKDDERVFFLVRHGERDHIKPNDPDHGAFVDLTDRGREQALNLGKAIAAGMGNVHSLRLSDVSFFSSPVGRCMQTAEYIGRGIHLESTPNASSCQGISGSHQLYVPYVEPCQPLAEFFVEHYDAYMETHKTGFYQGICRWLDGTAADPNYIDPAYFPLASRSEEMLQLMLEKGCARINIFATHDAWIVPCLAHFCGLKFSPQRWMNFLTGMAVVTRESCAKIDRIVPVTALDTGWLLF